jgi:septum formation protein
MLLLASASPARRRLLQQAAIDHRVRVSGFDEEAIRADDPVQLVQLLARAKAETVAAEEGKDAGGTLPLPVLGCDSLLVVEGEVFGKPLDAAEAEDRWRRMAGRWGELHTGHCLVLPPDQLPPPDLEPDGASPAVRLATVTTRVQFASVDEATIEAYVATGESLQCAGGFALEGRGGQLVERIEGCFSNVIGLSLPLLRRWLSGTGC